MKIVCGLGNPGEQYARSRHNVGFMVVDELAKATLASWTSWRRAKIATFSADGEEALLLKPMTFMNLSGEAVKEAADFFKVTLENLLVIHDDAGLEVGRVLVSRGGGDNGHKGVRSIIESLGSQDFARVRIGIGRPKRGECDMTHWVLSSFTEEEEAALSEGIARGRLAVHEWVLGGIVRAQNRVNRRVDPKERPSCPKGPQDRKEVQ